MKVWLGVFVTASLACDNLLGWLISELQQAFCASLLGNWRNDCLMSGNAEECLITGFDYEPESSRFIFAFIIPQVPAALQPDNAPLRLRVLCELGYTLDDPVFQ